MAWLAVVCIALSVVMTVIPYGFIGFGLFVLAVLVLVLPLEKLAYGVWIGIFISAFFGAYLGVPGNETIFLFRILLVLHFILFVFMKQKEMGHMRPTKWLFVLLGLWLAGFSVTLFWALSVGAGLRYVYYIFELGYLIFLSVYYMRTKRIFFQFSRIITVIYGLQLVIGMVEVLVGWHLPASGSLVYDTTTSAFQPTGLLFNTNDYAMFLAIFLPIVFWRLTFVQGAWRFVWMLGVLGVALYLVVMTYSRLGLIAMLLVVAALVVQYAGRLTWLIGAVLTFLVTSVLLVFPQALARVTGIIDASFTEKGASTTDRMERYRSLWEIVVNSGFRGVGAGNSPIQLNEYRLGHEVLQDAILAPHNFWLELLADGGFMGLITLGLFASFVGVAVYVWWTGRRGVDRVLRLVPMLVLLVFLFASVALSTVIDKRYLWLAVGMAVSVMNMSIWTDWRERSSG